MNKLEGIDPSDKSTSTNSLNLVQAQDPQNIKTLIIYENTLESNRTKYLNAWAESVSHLQSHLRILKVKIRNDFTMQLKDAEYYRNKMFQMEEKISELKELIKTELHCLLKEEKELHKELQFTERRIEDWGKPLSSNISKPAFRSTHGIQNQQNKKGPLGDFQKFLTSYGGHYGGWEEQDHLLFLRERRKYNGKPKFISAVQSILPDFSQDEIESHEHWYKKYELLKNLQKEAIKKWKENKLSINDQCPNSVTEQEGIIYETNVIKNPTYRRDIAERIKEWKKRQQLKKIEQEEKEKKEHMAITEERLKTRELQKTKKLAVEQYKAEKLNKVKSELLASQKIKELKTIEDKSKKNILMKIFREHDYKHIERIKFLRTQSASKINERFQKLENVKPPIEITVQRNRHRLLQPTQVWNQHCLQNGNHIDKPDKMNLHTIPHLAIPSWRKGVSNS